MRKVQGVVVDPEKDDVAKAPPNPDSQSTPENTSDNPSDESAGNLSDNASGEKSGEASQSGAPEVSDGEPDSVAHGEPDSLTEDAASLQPSDAENAALSDSAPAATPETTPASKSDPAEPISPPTKPKPRLSRLRRILRRLFLLLLVVLVLPYILVLAYLPPVVHPVSTLMLKDLLTGTSYSREWVSLDDIAPVLVQSVLMSEDGKFCSHNGVDWAELRGVVDGALGGEATRGASTIPMQTAKNLFLPPSRSVLRKALELPIALFSDLVWSKRRMMEIYLNIAEWAPGVYGIEAAARHHFGTSAAQLNPGQAALLAVTLPNPYLRDPARPSRTIARLALIIEGRARQSGAYIKCLDE